MSDKAISRDSDKFMLRLPDGMRDRIATEAKDSGRSMNSEIVARLEWSFSDAERLSELGMTKVSQRLEASAQVFENLMIGLHDKRISAFIATQASKGRIISRTQALHEILDEYFALTSGQHPAKSLTPAGPAIGINPDAKPAPTPSRESPGIGPLDPKKRALDL